MNITETAKIHTMARALDSRIMAPDKGGLIIQAWQIVLRDIPAEETETILLRLYSKPQMLVLQPGHIVEAWEEIKEERAKTMKRIRHIDNYLRVLGDSELPEIVQAKRDIRAELLSGLPPHARAQLGEITA